MAARGDVLAMGRTQAGRVGEEVLRSRGRVMGREVDTPRAVVIMAVMEAFRRHLLLLNIMVPGRGGRASRCRREGHGGWAMTRICGSQNV